MASFQRGSLFKYNKSFERDNAFKRCHVGLISSERDANYLNESVSATGIEGGGFERDQMLHT